MIAIMEIASWKRILNSITWLRTGIHVCVSVCVKWFLQHWTCRNVAPPNRSFSCFCSTGSALPPFFLPDVHTEIRSRGVSTLCVGVTRFWFRDSFNNEVYATVWFWTYELRNCTASDNEYNSTVFMNFGPIILQFHSSDIFERTLSPLFSYQSNCVNGFNRNFKGFGISWVWVVFRTFA